MLKLGLTGGIGSGKSTAVDAFRALDVPIIDADQIAKDFVKAGEPALNDIIDTFGKALLRPNKELDRKALKEIIFSDAIKLTQLESILHPRIKAEIKQQIKKIEARDSPPTYIIVDVPLLVESNYQTLFDKIIVVDCLPKQQVERVLKRDNLTKKTLDHILDKQIERTTRNKVAHYILDNTKSINDLKQQVENLHNIFILNSL